MAYGLDSGAASTSGASGSGNWWDWFGKSDASGSPNWLNAAQLVLSGYNTLKQPSYKNVPLSPEEKAIYQLYMGQATDPRTKDNRAQAAEFAKGQLSGIAPNLPWNRNTPFSMAYMGLTPPTNLNPGAQNYLKNMMGGGTPAPSGLPMRNNPNFVGAPVNPDTSGQREPFMQQWSPAEGDSGKPEYGESIEGWMGRNPQGANPSTYEGFFPTRGGANDPNAPANPNAPLGPRDASPMQYSPIEAAGFASFLKSQGVKDFGTIAIKFLTGGLIGAAYEAAKTLWNHYQNTKPTTPATGTKPHP